MRKMSLEEFNTMPVRAAVSRNAIPAMCTMLLFLVYNLADTFFIGMTHDPLQLAAISLTTPLFTMFSAISNIFGMGGTSVISRAMGGKTHRIFQKGKFLLYVDSYSYWHYLSRNPFYFCETNIKCAWRKSGYPPISL